MESHVDIDNFIEYWVTQIYIDNRDWPHNNIKFWNSPTIKWRWILYDADFGWGLLGDSDYSLDTLSFALGEQIGSEPQATFLLSKLLENDSFQKKFINRFADQMNSLFSYENVEKYIDELSLIMADEMDNHYKRWDKSYE